MAKIEKSESDATTRAHSESPAAAGRNGARRSLAFRTKCFGSAMRLRIAFIASTSPVSVDLRDFAFPSVRVSIRSFVWDLVLGIWDLPPSTASMAGNNPGGLSSHDSLVRSRAAPREKSVSGPN